MKILTNEKYYYTLVFICVAAYVFSFLGNFYSINNKLNAYEELYASLIASSKEFNNNLFEENNSNNNNNNTQLDQPLFDDAIAAINYAYNFTLSNPYDIKVEGMVTATTMGLTVNVKVQGTQIYYENGAVLIETKRYEMNSNFGQTMSTLSYYENNDCWRKGTSSVYMNERGDLVANYNEGFNFIDNYGSPKQIIVNESTIAKQVYFKINRNVYTNKIESYSASVVLKPTLATKGYAEQVKEEGGLDSMPNYKTLELNCIIDAKGNLVSYNLKENYTSTMNLFGGITIECYNNSNYYITSTTNPSIPQPVV